jgi:hypothetical protein
MGRRFFPLAGTSIVTIGVALIGCGDGDTPTAIADVRAPHFNHNHNAADGADKGYIDGWFDGRDVSLRYTKSYFCAEPPLSGAASNCVIGAGAEVAPRPGKIPLIFAVAAVGFQPDPSTLSCAPGSPCINHPAMIDASRIVAGATNVPGIPHSHIIGERGAGWHRTVNVRVFKPAVWNQIVAAKSLAKVRELQADPAVGGAGLISPDTTTNIFFFIEVQPER